MARFRLLDVLLMAGLLAMVVLAAFPAVLRLPMSSSHEEALRELARLRVCWQHYRNDVGRWPPYYGGDFSLDLPASSFSSLWENVHGLAGWKGPYLSPAGSAAGATSRGDPDAFTDPWGTPYLVHYLGRGCEMGRDGGIVLSSAGPNRTPEVSRRDLASGAEVGDDVVLVVTRHLDLLW